jgi:hypothetical protein
MTSWQHQAWIDRGSPFVLCRPLAALRGRLRAAGYTVYDIGNSSHLDHQPPEDHTPYSETGWPGTSPYGVGMAIDIMPPPAGSGLPSLQVLGRRLFDDRQAGRAPFIKYMNWGPTSDGAAVQDRWMSGWARWSSSDTGHIHISCRTDYATSAAADGYDPLGGGEFMATASDIIVAYSQGMPTTPDGKPVEPVKWQIRREAWEKSITQALAAIAARVDIDPAELEAIKAAARDGALSAADGLVAAVLTGLPDGDRITKADVEQAVRDAFAGGLAAHQS